MLSKNRVIDCPRCDGKTQSVFPSILGKNEVFSVRCWVKMNQTEINVLGPNVIIDVCPKCNGIWFDKDELKKILKDRKLSDYLTKNIGTQSKSKFVCPRCGGLMDIENAEEIEVDVCLNCSGVWLDQGELEGLKTKSEKGFHGNKEEKASEKWEEMVKRNRESTFNKFIRKLTR